MRIRLAFAAVAAWASVAAAADKPVIAPAPGWVKAVALPTPRTDDDAAIQILLQDQQYALEPGRQTAYTAAAIRIQTPQGLAAGNISLPWRPETDVLTVHKLLIRRGDRVIDVLASGQTFTVIRRESNLESAMLDGVLTANIQPEGLQVGDVLEFAASVSSSNPVLKGHVEQIAGGWGGLPIGRAHLRMQWPSSLPLRLRQTEPLPPLKPVKSGETSSVELSLDRLEPLNPPKGAPPRFGMGRLVEATDFGSWADLAALEAPLYRKAAVLPPQGPLQAELARIKALSPDPKVRAEAALALVQDRIRYVALQMGLGALVPADAETTWSRRFGDCKGKTALLLALLHALNIEAEPVAVNTIAGDGLNERLPMIGLFDHVLVRAKIGGRTYWLDGTRSGDTKLDSIQVPAFGWGLPLVPQGAVLVRMMPPPLEEPTQSVSIRMDARAGISLPAPTRIETVVRGDEAVVANLSLANLSGDARDRALREYWKEEYDFVDVRSTSATFDAARRELRFVMEGEARMDWSGGRYHTDGSGIGYKADFSRDPGPNREAPFAVAYPFYTRVTQTILLPPGFSGFKVGGDSGNDVNRTVAGIEYRRQVRLADAVFTVETSQRSVMPEFPATEAAAAQATLRELADQAVYIVVPRSYRLTEKEVAAKLTTTPSDAEGFVNRGILLMDQQRYDEAIADFDRAVALNPKGVWPLANRGLAYVWKGDTAAADRDLDAAQAIDPRNPVVLRARGLIAQRNDKHGEAVAAYTAALEADPNNAFALGNRAEAHRALGNTDQALMDSAAALKLQPGWPEIHLLRANVFRAAGKREQGLAEAAVLAATNPNDVFSQVAAARIYAGFGQREDAMRAFDRAIAIKPETYIYINRSQVRSKQDLKGRYADLEEALRLDPKSIDALIVKAELQREVGNHKGAIATLSEAIARSPTSGPLLLQRGIAYALSGEDVLSEKDFKAARVSAEQASHFNKMCWDKATAGVALESALEDCDTALAKAPGTPGYLDSRGLVLLRLGRVDEAIAEYGRALAKRPDLASSLYGRAIAWARKGDKERSAADAAAALRADADVRSDYERYGITL